MKRCFFFFGMFFLLVLETNAQKVPGYQGKKVYFQYEAIPKIQWLDFGRYRNYDKNGNRDDKPYEFKHNFGLHTVLSKNKSLGIDITTTLGPRYFTDFSNQNQVDELFSINATQIGLSFKHFSRKKGYIAPLGAFFELRPFAFMGKTTYEGRFVEVAGSNNAIYIPVDVPYEVTSPEFSTTLGVAVFFGNQWILLDRLMLSYSFGLTYYSIWINDPYPGVQLAAVRKYISTLVSDNFIPDFKIGVGVLLF